MPTDTRYLPRRSRFRFGEADALQEVETMLSVRPWDRRVPTVGGRLVSASGMPAAFIVRRDHVLDVPLRFYESEWEDIDRLLAWGQSGEAFFWWPDALEDSEVYAVFLEAPAAGEAVEPRRSTQFVDMLEVTVSLRKVSNSRWLREWSNPTPLPPDIPGLGIPTYLPSDGSRGMPATMVGGTYLDVGVRHQGLQGTETLEVWLAEEPTSSGDVLEPSPGVFVGSTDFRELPLGEDISLAQLLDENPDALPLRYSVGVTPVRPNVVTDVAHPAEGQMLEAVRACSRSGGYITFPQIHQLLGDAPLRGRVFARIYLESRAVGIGGVYYERPFTDWSGTNTGNWRPVGRKIYARPGLSAPNANITYQNINQLSTNHSWAPNVFNLGAPDGDGWFNCEIQFEDTQVRVRMWEDVDTEPGWQYTAALDANNGANLAGDFALIFQEMAGGAGTERTLCSYFAITTDPTEAAIPYPGTAGASGELQEPSPGVYTFWTDFSEFPLGPMPLDSFVWVANMQSVAVVPHPEDAGQQAVHFWNGIGLAGQSTDALGRFALIYEPWDAYVGTSGDLEVLVRGYQRVSSLSNSGLTGSPILAAAMVETDGVGPGTEVSGGEFVFGGAEWKNSSGSTRGAGARNVGGGGATSGSTYTISGVNVLERRWARFRRTEIDGSNVRWRIREWTGALEDEPGTWSHDQTTNWLGMGRPNRAGIVVTGRDWMEGAAMFDYMAFSTAPDAASAPDEVQEAPIAWFLARTVAASSSATQVVRVTHANIRPGRTYRVALRYRQGAQYSPGATFVGGDLAPTWPSLSRGQEITQADPAVLTAATWSRTAADAERVTLSITPDNDTSLIRVWRRPGTSGAWTEIDTITGPHAPTIQYVDGTISGETTYQYSLSTADGGRGNEVTVWTGPAGIPTHLYDVPFGAGYQVGFNPSSAAYATELHDAYDNAGGVHAMALRAVSAVGATEVNSGTLANVPSPDFTFPAQLRHRVTSFGVDDFGQFGVTFNVTVPGSE